MHRPKLKASLAIIPVNREQQRLDEKAHSIDETTPFLTLARNRFLVSSSKGRQGY